MKNIVGYNNKFVAYTDKSRKHARNQDSFLIGQNIFCVFDGVSCSIGNGRAADVASDEFSKMFIKQHKKLENIEDVKNIIESTLNKIHASIIKNNAGSTTASIVTILNNLNGSKTLVIANLGDSRVYLKTKKIITQITIDDIYLVFGDQKETKARKLQKEVSNLTSIDDNTPHDIRNLFYQRNIITNCISASKTELNIQWWVKEITNPINKKLLICTDGLSDNLTDDQINEILNKNYDPEEAVKELVYQARKVMDIGPNQGIRSKEDDLTVILIELEEKVLKKLKGVK